MDKGEGLPYVLEQFWISNGTDFVSEDGSKADGYINSQAGVEAATFLNELIQNGYANLDPIQKDSTTERQPQCWEAPGKSLHWKRIIRI